jgi:hypothetical protein
MRLLERMDGQTVGVKTYGWTDRWRQFCGVRVQSLMPFHHVSSALFCLCEGQQCPLWP